MYILYNLYKEYYILIHNEHTHYSLFKRILAYHKTHDSLKIHLILNENKQGP